MSVFSNFVLKYFRLVRANNLAWPYLSQNITDKHKRTNVTNLRFSDLWHVQLAHVYVPSPVPILCSTTGYEPLASLLRHIRQRFLFCVLATPELHRHHGVTECTFNNNGRQNHYAPPIIDPVNRPWLLPPRIGAVR